MLPMVALHRTGSVGVAPCTVAVNWIFPFGDGVAKAGEIVKTPGADDPPLPCILSTTGL
jgi:hypothetical protein